MELLISEVQKRPVFWNKFHAKYRDRIHNEKEWNAVAIKTKMNSKYIIFLMLFCNISFNNITIK